MRKLIDKDISNLGERDFEYFEVGTKANANGLMQMHTYRKTKLQAQGILTEEEAMTLPFDCWSVSPDCFKEYGSHHATVNGRRFFTDYPTKEDEAFEDKGGEDNKDAPTRRDTPKKVQAKAKRQKGKSGKSKI